MNHSHANSNTNHIYHGIFWKIASCFCFAGTNGLVRYLSGGSSLELTTPLPIYTIMFFQNAIGAALILPIILQNKPLLHALLCSQYRTLHIIRITTAVFGIGLWYLSLQYIPLTQVIALSFASPFIAILGAVIFLQEQLNIYRIISVILSIVGGFLIARPDLGLSNSAYIGWLAILPLTATLIFAVDKVITKKLLMHGESVLGVTLLLILFTAPLCLLPASYYGWHTPQAEHWPWLFLLAFLGVCAHFTFSKAFAVADVTVLIPFSITKILFCGLIGYFVFAELPNTLNMWIGIIVATISAITLNYEKQHLKKQK